MSTAEQRPAPAPIEPPEITLRTITVVHWGMAVWGLILILTLAIPALREGDRWWWPWVPVAGLGLGLLGHVYLRRGRGNAAGA